MEIDVLKLKEMRDGGESVTLLDVREPHELAICKVAGSVDIPMQQVPQRHQQPRSVQPAQARQSSYRSLRESFLG